jgi:hypothetical protein
MLEYQGHVVETTSVDSGSYRGLVRAASPSLGQQAGPGGPPSVYRVTRGVLVALLVGSLLVVEPAVAQTNPVCADESGTLVSMIEGFIQLTTALGLMGLLVVWQADELMEMFMLGQDRKHRIKRHKRGAMKSATVLVLLGPLFTVAASMMDLPIAQCVDLVPF